MKSSTDYINDNKDDLGSKVDASTCSGDNLYDRSETEETIINNVLNVWVNTNYFFVRAGSIKIHTSTCQKIVII